MNRHKSTHLAKKKKPLPEIHQCSSKCRYSVVNRHRLLRHQKSCRYHRASMSQIVPLVSNRRVCEVSNSADVSQRKVVQIVRGVLGDDMLEPGLEAALRAADGAPEKRPVLNEIYQQLRTWTIKHEVQYIGDCKITNLLFGKF